MCGGGSSPSSQLSMVLAITRVSCLTSAAPSTRSQVYLVTAMMSCWDMWGDLIIEVTGGSELTRVPTKIKTFYHLSPDVWSYLEHCTQ